MSMPELTRIALLESRIEQLQALHADKEQRLRRLEASRNVVDVLAMGIGALVYYIIDMITKMKGGS